MNDLKKYVLYSDSISTIIPDEFQFVETDDPAWNESMSAILWLEKNGVYKRTYASSILSTQKEKITKEFMSRIKNVDAYKKIRKGEKNARWWQLYLSKMDYDLRKFLLDEGLAEHDKYSGKDCLLVESDCASIYMGLLAEYSCRYGHDFYSTVTDKQHYNELVYNAVDDKLLKTKFTLTDVLPVPIEGTPIDDILRFKASRENELLRFQALLSDFESKLLGITDLGEYRRKLDMIEMELKIKSNDLKKLLTENKIIYIANSIDKVINSFPKSVHSILSAGEVISVSPIVEKCIESRREYRSCEISYLVRAKQAGIV